MAPALTSNSFRLTSRTFSRPDCRPLKAPATIVCVKQSPRNDESKSDSSGKENKFKFDFGRLPDPKSLIPVVRVPEGGFFVIPRRKEPRTVFVAGATGQAGIRIAQTLLRQGFSVRAGVPDLAAAQELARLAAAYKIISPEESKRLNAVESTFSDPESIAKAIGPATKVVVTISSSENGPSAAVTTDDALDVVRAAQLAGVGHVAVVYDSGASGPSSAMSTSNMLDGITSFFNNIFSRPGRLTVADFLAKLVETDVSYTLIKTALADDYEADAGSYPLVVSKEGTSTEAELKVSKSQIATLVADVFSNTEVAENKVVEVFTSPSATSKPIAELFSAIPQDGRRPAFLEAQAKAKAAEEAVKASEKASEAAEAASFTEEAQERAVAAGASLESLLSKAKNIGGDLSWEKLSSQITTAVSQKTDGEPKVQVATVRVSQKTDGEPKVQVATVRGQAKAFNLTPRKAVVKKPATKPKPQKAVPEPKPEVNVVFGGLFKQETIYMDD